MIWSLHDNGIQGFFLGRQTCRDKIGIPMFQSLPLFCHQDVTRWVTRPKIYRVSHELSSLLRESVPYVKIYRYNPKHLCPKLNGYGDNGKRKVWTSWGCTHYTCQLAVIYVRPCVGCHVTECAVSHVSQASHVTSAFCIPVSCIVLRTLRITMTRVWMFLCFNLMALCHSQVTLMLSTDINITETTYSCQFQYEFGNQ